MFGMLGNHKLSAMMLCYVSRQRGSMVVSVRCTGALYCWNFSWVFYDPTKNAKYAGDREFIEVWVCKVIRIVRDLIQLLQKQNGAVFFSHMVCMALVKWNKNGLDELRLIYDSGVLDDAYSATQWSEPVERRHSSETCRVLSGVVGGVWRWQSVTHSVTSGTGSGRPQNDDDDDDDDGDTRWRLASVTSNPQTDESLDSWRDDVVWSTGSCSPIKTMHRRL